MGDPKGESAPLDRITIKGRWGLLQSKAIVGNHGQRPVVLTGGCHGQLVTRNENGLLVDATADNPNIALILSAPEMLDALKAQHQAIDTLFAMLIDMSRETDGSRDGVFFPSKCGQPWEAMELGNAAIAQAEGE